MKLIAAVMAMAYAIAIINAHAMKDIRIQIFQIAVNWIAVSIQIELSA